MISSKSHNIKTQKSVFFDITNMYSKVPVKELIENIKLIRNDNGLIKALNQEFIKYRKILTQKNYFQYKYLQWGMRWCSWLRHCATSRKVAGSIGICNFHNPSGRTMALGLTQPLTKMGTRNIYWGKGGRCVRLTTLPPSCVDCLETLEPQTSGTLRSRPGL
jgi:hypothetical protein